MKPLLLFGPLLLLAGCQSVPPASQANASATARGEALARASCSSCHAVGRAGYSPNPNAPPFASIANQEGLTARTLSTFLHGAHNYPREMDFTLNGRQADDLVAYMVTLKDPNYRRPPDM